MLFRSLHSLIIGNMFLAAPTLAPVTADGHSYLTLNFFPGVRSTNPVPAELLGQLKKPNLVAYSWENTQQSLRHWNVLSQFTDFIREEGMAMTTLLARMQARHQALAVILSPEAR